MNKSVYLVVGYYNTKDVKKSFNKAFSSETRATLFFTNELANIYDIVESKNDYDWNIEHNDYNYSMVDKNDFNNYVSLKLEKLTLE